MIKCGISLVILFLLTCTGLSAQTTTHPKPVQSLKQAGIQTDTSYWVLNFRKLRELLYTKNKNAAKAFFSFPLTNKESEIWWLVTDRAGMNGRIPNKAKPFTEKDFDKYFRQLFPDAFSRCLLKIKADELYQKGSFETALITDSSSSYKIYAAYDPVKKTVELNFSQNTVYKDENGEITDGGEFNIIYFFRITAKGHLHFVKLMLAG